MRQADDPDVEALLATVLGPAADRELSFDAAPTRLVGGGSADLFSFRLADGPPDLAGRDLVLRVLPRTGTAAECVIQRAVFERGYPAPEVLRVGSHAGRRFVLMAHVGGPSLFAAQNPLRGASVVPPRLAELMLALHRLDPSPVRTALLEIGEGTAADLTQRSLADIDASFSAIDAPTHARLRSWFDRHRPEATRAVICHGDLHALNVLVGDRHTVVDWELAGLGPAAFDVARTKLLLHAVPLELPRAARPIVQRLGGRAAERFARHYAGSATLASDDLRWHEALHAARLVGRLLGEPVRNRGADAVLDGWEPTLPLLQRLLRQRTGVAVAT